VLVAELLEERGEQQLVTDVGLAMRAEEQDPACCTVSATLRIRIGRVD
jgi:hypothetical protein